MEKGGFDEGKDNGSVIKQVYGNPHVCRVLSCNPTGPGCKDRGGWENVVRFDGTSAFVVGGRSLVRLGTGAVLM